MLVGERIVMSDPDPAQALADQDESRILRRLSDDVLWDVFLVYTRNDPREVRRNWRYLDLIRAELASRHAPEPFDVCARCLHTAGAHDELHMTCPEYA